MNNWVGSVFFKVLFKIIYFWVAYIFIPSKISVQNENVNLHSICLCIDSLFKTFAFNLKENFHWLDDNPLFLKKFLPYAFFLNHGSQPNMGLHNWM